LLAAAIVLAAFTVLHPRWRPHETAE